MWCYRIIKHRVLHTEYLFCILNSFTDRLMKIMDGTLILSPSTEHYVCLKILACLHSGKNEIEVKKSTNTDGTANSCPRY